MMEMFRFLGTTLWKSLFGKNADSLEAAVDREDELRIIEDSPLSIFKYISMPLDKQSSPPSLAFVAGLLEGVLDSANMV